MNLQDLLKAASKDRKSLRELRNMAEKLQQFELVVACENLDKELFPLTAEQELAMHRYDEIELALRMVEISFHDKSIYYRIDKALDMFNMKKGKFSIKDAAKILTDAERLFPEE